MKEFWIIIAIAAVGLYFVFFGIPFQSAPVPIDKTMPEPNPAANQSSTTSPNSTSATRLPSPTAATVATAAFSPPATATAENQNLPAATVMENMRSVIRLYGSQFGGNPVGNNTEITAALTGNNPKQVNFIQPDSGLRLSDKGELVDPWGTPFFFHQLSGTVMEIHSAGPDRKMWTADDVVAK